MDEAKAGRLDRDAVTHVLGAAGIHARLRREPPAGLSEREVDVLVLLARGLTNKEIGRRLFISPRTVGHHVAHIYEKTAVKTRAAAALFAAEHDLVGPPSK
jgi:DNA-binding NarL/FixJ family response regulator